MNSITKRVKSKIKFYNKKQLDDVISKVYLTDDEKKVLIDHVNRSRTLIDISDEMNVSVRTAARLLKSALIKISHVI